MKSIMIFLLLPWSYRQEPRKRVTLLNELEARILERMNRSSSGLALHQDLKPTNV
jgi:hypothetical protein